ncbi:hypothetical protein WCT79_04500 [Pectobacterium carotovorum]|uniref:hypothetical protein n=1 Tax=Pectobacterium carotovorum TaxID=554 RepID=UPI003019F89D
MSILPSWKIATGALVAGIVIGWYVQGLRWDADIAERDRLAREKKARAEQAIAPIEQKAAENNAVAKVEYRTITKEVVRYVQTPGRTVCEFDDDAIRLRQRAIDAASNIPGFDDAAVQAE